jgi:hypothetical protein
MKHLYRSILLFAFVLAAGAIGASAQQKVCGSVDKFNQTHRWQDLPGCTDNSDYSNQTGARTLMSRAKGQFKDFFETWEKGDWDHLKSNSNCTAYDFNAESYWNSDAELIRAKPAYDELRRTVERYMEWLPDLQNLWQRYFYAMTYIAEAKKGDMSYAKMAVDFSKDLQKAIAGVQSKGVLDELIMPASGTIPAQTLGEIKSKLSTYLGEANNSLKIAIDVDNAKWEPFTKLLTGDRLKFFNDSYRGGSNVFGRWRPVSRHAGRVRHRARDVHTHVGTQRNFRNVANGLLYVSAATGRSADRAAEAGSARTHRHPHINSFHKRAREEFIQDF